MTGSPIKSALKQHKKAFINVAIFSAIINIVMLIPAIYMLQVYDRVLTSGNPYTLWMLTLMLVGVFILMGFLEWVRSDFLIRISESFDKEMNPKIIRASFNYQRLSGKAYPSQAVNDLNKVRQFLTGSACFAFFDAPWAPVYLAVLFFFHPLLGSVALVGTLLLLVLGYLNEVWGKGAQQAAAVSSTQSAHVIDDYIKHADVAYAMGMQPRLQQYWNRIHRSMIHYQGDASRRSGIIVSISKSLRIALQSLMLAAGAWLAINNQITAGMMVAGSILIGRMLSPVEQLVSAWKQWAGVRISNERLNALLQVFPEAKTKMQLPEPKGQMSIESITFVPNEQQLSTLQNISFKIDAGDVVGVIGPSGSGKSTLIKVLAGIWMPRFGKVRIDGADLQHWDADSLGKYIGYLPQETGLFPGTIAENISRFSGLDHEEIISAAKLAGVHEMILKMAHGYDTRIEVGGLGLSGGEKQRIGLARAVYGEPNIVILDEPNANLDEAGEAQLVKTIQALKEKNTTVFFVTHKTNILGLTDKLVVLNNGQLTLAGATQHVLQAMQKARQNVTSMSA